MKKVFYYAAAMLLTMGMVSCEIEDDGGDGGSNNSNTSDSPTSTEWVDLGLPSGLLWASCNLGTSTIGQYGNYYAWGETQPKSVYSWETYQYGDYDSDNGNTLYKYNTYEGFGHVDGITTLENIDDAARAARGGGARMPTASEWQELLTNTTSQWTRVNNTYGRLFTASNGNSVFFPAAGRKMGEELGGEGESGLYWTSSLSENTPISARCCYLTSDDRNLTVSSRDRGLTIRPVRPASKQ